MKLKAYGISDIGKKRKTNQDTFVVDDTLQLYVVADGMGGHKGGEVASQMVVQLLGQYCRQHPSLEGRDLLDQGINFACRAIHDKAKDSEALSGMGTTVMALLVRQGVVFIGQVGDSRAYLMNEQGTWQLTEDHSLLNDEIRSGRLSAGQAASFQFKNIITRSVGYERSVTVDIYRRKLKPQDHYLLCTDGLSGVVGTDEFSSPILSGGLESGLKDLVSLANERGGEDNITGLVLQIAAD